jgi:hypothetical protein
MTDQAEPEDTCRPVEIDGETIRLRGSGELTAEGREALTVLVQLAKAKLAAEPPPIRQQLRAHAFNAVAPALQRHEEWLRLTVRRTVADAVLAAIEEFLNIGEAEAWCKTCRRVWDGKQHRCEGNAEILLARVRDVANTWFLEGEPGPTRAAGKHLLRVLDEPTPGPAATQATRPGHVITIEGDPAAAHEAIRQMDADTTNTHTGLVVQPYRNDRGENVWVFRCWGTDDGCDGWLSLDHYSEQSAERARDRHTAEEHPNEEQH